MTATSAILEKAKPATPKPKGKKPAHISWEEFQRKYLSREDKFKYEWVNGMVEKTERTMNQYQIFIATNLMRFFFELFNEKKVSGLLTKETDTLFLETIHRRPDMAWFSEKQLAFMAYGENQVPAFVIEIISSNDQINKVQKKMKNYRDAGVEVVWQIFPELLEVNVFHGSKMTTLSGDEVCPAAPALPEFALKVSDIFKKPPKPEEIPSTQSETANRKS